MKKNKKKITLHQVTILRLKNSKMRKTNLKKIRIETKHRQRQNAGQTVKIQVGVNSWLLIKPQKAQRKLNQELIN